MKKCLLSLLILISLITNIFAMKQENRIPQPLKVLYPFSVEVRFEKPFNLIKANIDDSENLLISDEDQWSSTLTDSLSLTLMALKPGQINVPKIQIITYDELGADTLFTDPFDITVTAVSDSTSQLTDIKALQPAKAALELESEFTWLYTLIKYLIIILIILLLIYLTYRYYPLLKEKLYQNKLAESTLKQLPWDYALRELKVIKDRMLLVKGKEYLFSIEMSLLLRRFLEKQFRFPAAERTTTEIKSDLKKLEVEENDKIINILSLLDEVKYTKGKIVANFQTEEIYQWFENYLKQLKSHEEAKAKEMEARK